MAVGLIVGGLPLNGILSLLLIVLVGYVVAVFMLLVRCILLFVSLVVIWRFFCV